MTRGTCALAFVIVMLSVTGCGELMETAGKSVEEVEKSIVNLEDGIKDPFAVKDLNDMWKKNMNSLDDLI